MRTLTKLLAVAAILFANIEVMACEVCKKQQPEILRGVAHGAGPQSAWDYVVVGSIAVVMMISLFYSVKWILRPGEKERSHIKRSIFN